MIPLTLEELKERLAEVEETQLLELLGLSSEDLVTRFSDIIEERMDKLRRAVDWES